MNDASFGNGAWTNPGDAEASDDQYAQAAPGGSPTRYLRATDFGFAIPAGAMIQGITVFIERRALVGTIVDNRVRIVKAGFVAAVDRAQAGTWLTMDAVATYGGVADPWGETWTAADINDSAFGVVLSVEDSVDLAMVDQITITVTFSLCGNGVVETGEQCDDGNTTAGDCCSPTCRYESVGTSCGPPRSDLCTADLCNATGTCLPSQICTDHPISGRKLNITRSSSGKEKVSFVSTDPNALFATPSSGSDPRLAGGTVDLLSQSEGLASFELPAGIEWMLNRSGTVYKFSNRQAPAGPSPVKVAIIKQGRGIKISGKAAGLQLTGAQGQVALRIRTGLERSCALFDGSTIVRDEAGRFQARDAAASATDCGDVSLGLPGATSTSTTTVPSSTTTSSTTTFNTTSTTAGTTTSTSSTSTTTSTMPVGSILCPPAAIVQATVTLIPAPDGSTASQFAGIKVSLSYPAAVSLPGSGALPIGDPNDPSTREVLLDRALYGGLVIFNDTNTALVTTLALSSPEGLDGPLAFEKVRFDCVPGVAVNPGGFSCAVLDEADQLGAVIPPSQRPACQVAVSP